MFESLGEYYDEAGPQNGGTHLYCKFSQRDNHRLWTRRTRTSSFCSVSQWIGMKMFPRCINMMVKSWGKVQRYRDDFLVILINWAALPVSLKPGIHVTVGVKNHAWVYSTCQQFCVWCNHTAPDQTPFLPRLCFTLWPTTWPHQESFDCRRHGQRIGFEAHIELGGFACETSAFLKGTCEGDAPQG